MRVTWRDDVVRWPRRRQVVRREAVPARRAVQDGARGRRVRVRRRGRLRAARGPRLRHRRRDVRLHLPARRVRLPPRGRHQRRAQGQMQGYAPGPRARLRRRPPTGRLISSQSTVFSSKCAFFFNSEFVWNVVLVEKQLLQATCAFPLWSSSRKKLNFGDYYITIKKAQVGGGRAATTFREDKSNRPAGWNNYFGCVYYNYYTKLVRV